MFEQCTRSHEVEPLFDQRLSAEAAVDLRSHLAGCAACTRAHTALSEMRAALRESGDAPNAFVLKRLRRELLEKVGGTAPPPRRSYARLAGALSAFVVVLASVVGMIVWLTSPSPTATNIIVTAAPGAQFSRENSGNRQIVRLTDGEFEFDVQEQPDGLRLLVVVPDGEIEDIGTRFRVVVKNSVTTEVSVSAGEVELRKIGAAPLRLIAGMTYRPVAPEATASATPTAEASVSPSAAAPIVATHGAGSSHGHASQVSAAPSIPTAPTTSQSSASARGGATAEDAAYMSVVRMLREGKREDARAAAKAYLRDFPDGLRRAEMGTISAGN